MYTAHIVKLCCFVGNNKPDWRDLESKIVTQCGAYWDKLGLKLGLPKHVIDNIDMDHAYHPQRSVACCREVLVQWLQQIPLPTWGKLEDAIKEVEEDITLEIGNYIATVWHNYFKS